MWVRPSARTATHGVQLQTMTDACQQSCHAADDAGSSYLRINGEPRHARRQRVARQVAPGVRLARRDLVPCIAAHACGVHAAGAQLAECPRSGLVPEANWHDECKRIRTLELPSCHSVDNGISIHDVAMAGVDLAVDIPIIITTAILRLISTCMCSCKLRDRWQVLQRNTVCERTHQHDSTGM